MLKGFLGFNDVTQQDDDEEEESFIAQIADTCDIDLDTDVHEVMVSMLPNESFAVAARLDRPGKSVVDCLIREGNEPTKVGEFSGVVADDITVMAVGNVLVGGNSEELELAADATPPRWVRQVAGLDEALAATHVVVNTNGLWMVSMKLERSSEDTTMVTTFRGQTAADADLMLNTFRTVRADVAKEVSAKWDGKARRRLRKWLRRVAIRRTVTHGVEIRLRMPDESSTRVAQRARAAKLFAQGMGDRVDRKRTELSARTVLRTIAKRLHIYAKKNKTGWRKLSSFPSATPLTPRTVPRGELGETSKEEWSHATWKALDFSMYGERRYSYKIDLSPNGKRATIRAVADYDGDGTKQELSLSVRIVGDSVRTDPFVEVKNPFE